MRTPASDTELVVLIGPDGRPAGTHPKATVHTTNTPLHYAFSCYLTRPDGQVLLTRRALAKPSKPRYNAAPPRNSASARRRLTTPA